MKSKFFVRCVIPVLLILFIAGCQKPESITDPQPVKSKSELKKGLVLSKTSIAVKRNTAGTPFYPAKNMLSTDTPTVYPWTYGGNFYNYGEGLITGQPEATRYVISVEFTNYQTTLVRLGYVDLENGEETYEYFQPNSCWYNLYFYPEPGRNYLVYVSGQGNGYLFCEPM